MALLIFRRGGRTLRVAGRVEVAAKLGGVYLHDWRPEPVFVGKHEIVELRRRNTMRVHCFYCWNDADYLNSPGVKVCAEHAAGQPAMLFPSERWAPGMNDDPAPRPLKTS